MMRQFKTNDDVVETKTKQRNKDSFVSALLGPLPPLRNKMLYPLARLSYSILSFCLMSSDAKEYIRDNL